MFVGCMYPFPSDIPPAVTFAFTFELSSRQMFINSLEKVENGCIYPMDSSEICILGGPFSVNMKGRELFRF